MKESQDKLKKKIDEGKRNYKEKISKSFQSNDMKDVWNKMKTVVCFDKTRPPVTVDDGQTYADGLMTFTHGLTKTAHQTKTNASKLTNFLLLMTAYRLSVKTTRVEFFNRSR